ncbi:MAG: hypothetical protein NXI31_13380 [bacterium]|nr:hypothetical protein [bacterium]
MATTRIDSLQGTLRDSCTNAHELSAKENTSVQRNGSLKLRMRATPHQLSEAAEIVFIIALYDPAQIRERRTASPPLHNGSVMVQELEQETAEAIALLNRQAVTPDIQRHVLFHASTALPHPSLTGLDQLFSPTISYSRLNVSKPPLEVLNALRELRHVLTNTLSHGTVFDIRRDHRRWIGLGR